MAIAHDASSAVDHTSNSATATWSHTVGAGANRYALAIITNEDDTAADIICSSVTFDGVGMTLALRNTQTRGARDLGIEIWWMGEANLPSTGAYTILATGGGTVSEWSCASISLTGCVDQAPEASASKGQNEQGSPGIISTNITPITDGAWVVDGVASDQDRTYTAGGSQTKRFGGNGGGGHTGAGSTRLVASAAQVTNTWQTGSAEAAQNHVLVAIAPVTGIVLFRRRREE